MSVGSAQCWHYAMPRRLPIADEDDAAPNVGPAIAVPNVTDPAFSCGVDGATMTLIAAVDDALGMEVAG
jgi:hypothetical protein